MVAGRVFWTVLSLTVLVYFGLEQQDFVTVLETGNLDFSEILCKIYNLKITLNHLHYFIKENDWRIDDVIRLEINVERSKGTL